MSTLMTSVLFCYLAPPYFVDHVGDTQCRFTDLAKFHCDVVGAPKPEVSWYKDENKSPLLSEGGKYAIVFERGHVMLMISDVNSNDIGCYTCKVCAKLRNLNA